MAKQGKKYLAAAKLVDRTKLYPVSEAITLTRETNFVKFNASVQVSFRLNVDPRHADQQIRGAVVLPHGTGRSQKVLVITQGPKEKEALDAGADIVGGKELLEKIKGGWFEFDIIVATPDMMGELGKLGKILGPKGLMPNPKTGTVTMDVAKAVVDIKKGKVEYRVDKEGNIGVLVGKVSFTDVQLHENIKTLFDLITRARPAAVKGIYMKNVVITTTMGPGIKIDTATV